MSIESKVKEACKLHEINIIDLDVELDSLSIEGLHCMYKRGSNSEEAAYGDHLVYFRMELTVDGKSRRGGIRIMDSTQDNINESIGKLKLDLIEAMK